MKKGKEGEGRRLGPPVITGRSQVAFVRPPKLAEGVGLDNLFL